MSTQPTDDQKSTANLGGQRDGAGRKSGDAWAGPGNTKPPTKKMAKTYLNEEQMAWIDARAAHYGISRSAAIADLIDLAINDYGV